MADVRKPGEVGRFTKPPTQPAPNQERPQPQPTQPPKPAPRRASAPANPAQQAAQMGAGPGALPPAKPNPALQVQHPPKPTNTDPNGWDVRNQPGLQNTEARFAYWDNPLRVVRYHQALQSIPPEQRANIPLNEQGLSFAYDRLAQFNQGRPVEQWQAPPMDDTYYNATRSMNEPPNELRPYYEWQRATRDNPNPWKAAGMGDLYPMPKAEAEQYFDTAGMQTQGDNVLVPAAWLYQNSDEQQAIDQPLPNLINGVPEETWNRLKPWQKFLLSASPAGSGAAMGGGQGAIMGLLSGGIGGAVAGGVMGSGLGGLFGAAADNPAAQQAMSILNVLDWPAEQSERAIGLASQIINSTFDPETYGPVGEVLNNLPAAWEAGHFAENVAFLPVNQQGEIEAWELTSTEATKTKIPGATGQLVGGTNPASFIMAEARRRIAAGESLETVERDIRQMVGIRYDVQEMLGHMIIDPLNLLALGENALVKAGAKLAKNAPLLKAVDMVEEMNKARNIFNKEGAIAILGEYGRNLRLMKPEDAAKFGTFSRFIAGVDDTGKMLDYGKTGTARTAVAKAMQGLFGLTPQSRADAVTRNLASGLDIAIGDAQSVEEVEHLVKGVANLKPGDAVKGLDDADMMQWIESAEAQPAPQAVKHALPRVEAVTDAFKGVQDRPGIPGPVTRLTRLAEAVSTPEKPVTIKDVIRLFGEAESKQDFERIYRGLAETAQKNVAGGAVEKSMLDEILQGGYGKYAKDARMFYGEDGVPFTLEQYKARVGAALAQGIEEWSTQYFGVKPRGWAERASNAVKTFQTATMLNTPTFVANNWINNMMTLSWDGLIGVSSRKGRVSWLRGMGLDVGRLSEGVSPADLQPVGAEIGKAKKPTYRMGDIIREAHNGKRSRFETDLAKFANNVSLFPRLGAGIEAAASEHAYYNAIRPYWEAVWRGGKGFDPMGKEFKQLAQYLDALTPGASKKIEQMIARSKSRAEIEKAVFGGFKTHGLKDYLAPDDIETLNAVPGLIDRIDAGLKDIQTPEDVRRVIGQARGEVTKQIRNETRKQARAKAERLLTRMSVEGVAGGASAFDEVVDARASALMQHFDRMQAVTDDIEARGLRGKERAAVWAAARAEEDAVFRAFEDDEAAKWLGMYQALGSTDEEARALAALLGEGSQASGTMGLHSNWRRFFDVAAEEYANYHALPDDMPKIEKAKAWDEVGKKLIREYDDATLEEDRIMQKIDELTARLYARGKKDPDYAYRDMLNWRLSQRDVRRKMASIQSYYRSGKVNPAMEEWVDPALIEKVRGFTRGQPLHLIPKMERTTINEWFYKEVYRPLITEAATTGHNTQPKARPRWTEPPQGTPKPPKPKTPAGGQSALIQTPKQEAPKVDQSALWKRISETKPEMTGVLPDGQFDPTAKAQAIKYVRQNNPGAKVKRFNDITPEIWDTAVRNEQLRTKASEPLPMPSVAEVTGRTPERLARWQEIEANLGNMTRDEFAQAVKENGWAPDTNVANEQDITDAYRAFWSEQQRAGKIKSDRKPILEDRRTVENQELRARIAELEKTIATDEKTGALSNNAFEAEIEKIRARGEKPVVGFLDLRGLGKTNKEHGNAVGDAYLKWMVERAQEQGLTVYRRGGDELTVIGDDIQRLDDELFKLSRRLEGSIIDVNGRQYAGAKFHHGVAAVEPGDNPTRAADDIARERLYADPDAERYINKTYALRDVSGAGNQADGSAGGLDVRVGERTPQEGIEAAERPGLERPGRDRDAAEQAASAAVEGNARLTKDLPDLDAATEAAFREGDAVLVNDQTGEIVTPESYGIRRDIPTDGMNDAERAFVEGEAFQDYARIEARRMRGELADSEVITFTGEDGRPERREWKAPAWYRSMYEAEPKDGKKTLRKRLARVLDMMAEGQKPKTAQQAELIRNLRVDMLHYAETDPMSYNRDFLWYLGKKERVFEMEGGEIGKIVNDPGISADEARAKLGRYAEEISDEHLTRTAKENHPNEVDTETLPEIDGGEMDATAQRIADNIDRAEADADIEERFTRTKEDFERAVMDAMPEDGDTVLQLTDSLSRNFNPEIDTEEFYRRLGWSFGGEFAGEEGIARLQPMLSKVKDVFEKLFRSKDDPEATKSLVDMLDKDAVPFRYLEFNQKNWDAELGGTIQTPAGPVVMGIGQKAKMATNKGRMAFLGLIRPTLEEPSIVFRNTANETYYVKSFRGRNGEIEYIAIGKSFDGQVKIVTHHVGNIRDVKKVVRNGGMLLGVTAYDDADPSVRLWQTLNHPIGGPDTSSIAGLKRVFNRHVDGLTTFTESGRALMRIYKASDPTAAAHELIHGITPLMRQADADLLRTDLLKDMDLPEDWHTSMYYTEDGKQLTAMHPEAYERVSNAFARYLADGYAPTEGLATLFRKMKDWMLRVYKQITGGDLDIEVSDDTRKMFDRWVSGEPEAPRLEEPAPIAPETPGEINLSQRTEVAPSLWANTAEDMPLFSGTPQRAGETDMPEGSQRQPGLLFRMSPDDLNPDAPDMPTNIPQTRDLPVGTVDQMSAPPHEEALLEILRDRILPMLDRAESQIAGEVTKGNRLFNDAELAPEMRKQLRAYLGKVNAQMGDAKLAALRYGKARRDFALLPYERRYNMDTYLQTLMPYEFWYTRSMMNWAVRAANKPQIISNYMRMQQFFNEQQKRGGFPTRLRKKSFVRIPFLPEWMGEGVYFDPMRQVFPFLQITSPFERMYSQEVQAQRRAESLLQQQVEDGTLDATEAQQAIQSKNGLTWQDALAQAKNETDADVQNPLDVARMISGFSLPWNILYMYATGRQDEIGQLPVTRLVQAVTGAAGVGGARGVNLEKGIRNMAGLPEIDRYEDYRVDRMLANLAAEGQISAREAQTAMIDREGHAFDLAQRRVSAMGAFQYFGAPLAVDFFPEGEQELRQLKEKYSAAYERYKNGDKTALAKFMDKYPEYQARMASFQDPQERLKRFLISEVWERYNAMPALYKRQTREQLGDTFNEAFLSKETRSYDSIQLETLATWARQMGAEHLPNRTPDTPQIGLKFAPKETAQAVENYNAEADRLYPGIGKFLSSFYQMSQEEQDAAKKQYPQINAYYTWKNRYLAEHPDIIPWVTSEKSELYGMPQDLQQTVYTYRAQRADLFPNIDQVQEAYFNAADQKAYLKQHPELREYWDWRKAMAGANPKAAPYILSDQALQKAIMNNKSPEVSQEIMAKMSPNLVKQLLASFYAKESLRAGAVEELQDLWEEAGQPYGSLDTWIVKAIKPTLTGY